MKQHDRMIPPQDAFSMGMHMAHQEQNIVRVHGEVFIKMWDEATGEVQEERHKKNIMTLDGGLFFARKFFGDPLQATMLAVGTGASGGGVPDAPSNEQRSLNNEIFRKVFTERVYRTSTGAVSAIPTNIVDVVTVFNASEAVGALNEMALLAPVSSDSLVTNPNPNLGGQGGQLYDATVDVTSYDMILNTTTFGVVTKPATSIVSFTWRLTF